MKQKLFRFAGLFYGICAVLGAANCCFAEDVQKEECFFLSGLHASARGMSYWYDKSNGGLETVTGIPYTDYGTWTPISNPVPPKVQYVGYGSPLTHEQLKKLEQPEKSKK